MLDFLRKIIKPKYEPMNIIEIKADNILANFSYLQSLQKKAEIFPVLKSNAYGHGLKEICKILNSSEAKMVAVDSYPEAQIAYRYFKGKVLILGEMPIKAYDYTNFKRTEFVVYRSRTIKYLSKYGKRAKVHLFFNSGMNREGIKNIDQFIIDNKEYLTKVDLVGFCSHLASADDEVSELNKKQEDEFLKALASLRQAGFSPKYVHLGNSAAIFNLNNDNYSAFRSGLAFYGYSPFSDKEIPELKPALEIKSQIVFTQELEPGEIVSYNEKFIATTKTKIAIIPFGYFEGLDRRLSNKISFEVIAEKNTFLAKVVGRICMNISCLDLETNNAPEGTMVKIISSSPSAINSLVNISSLAGGVYEFLVKIQASIRRKII